MVSCGLGCRYPLFHSKIPAICFSQRFTIHTKETGDKEGISLSGDLINGTWSSVMVWIHVGILQFLLSTSCFRSCVYAGYDFCFLVMTLVNGGGFSVTNCWMFTDWLSSMLFGNDICCNVCSFLSLEHTEVVCWLGYTHLCFPL
jgi:hypothetical protein